MRRPTVEPPGLFGIWAAEKSLDHYTARMYRLMLPMNMQSIVRRCQGTASRTRQADSGQTYEPDPDFLEYARREAAESMRQLDIPFDF